MPSASYDHNFESVIDRCTEASGTPLWRASMQKNLFHSSTTAPNFFSSSSVIFLPIAETVIWNISTILLWQFPAYAVLLFQKVQHKSNFVHVGIEYTCGQINKHKQVSPVQAQTPTCSNQIGRSMTIPLLVSSSGILLTLSSHCTFIAARKNLGACFKEYFFKCITLNCPSFGVYIVFNAVVDVWSFYVNLFHITVRNSSTVDCIVNFMAFVIEWCKERTYTVCIVFFCL